ncbi:tail fiber domain-containing protein [Hymenobacter gummosus]|uniref:receptor protein-tyrosine kinase n=1 Tax=Hymenobacter gummosus TaxID=1776032 RepID=A0A3S0JFQ9_9BACT|nr:tail fiber domain-containing protein [Hymenobacter gummosus]RTQ51569.1 tail fiber domain-containing protein [Hymenobacter gummosus]
MQRLLRFTLPLAAALGLSLAARAQTPNAVGIGTTAPAASALLDLSSTTKGFLAPRMTAAERTAISSPARGLLVYQTDGLQLGFWYYTGTSWTYLNPAPAGDNLGSHTASQGLNMNGNAISFGTFLGQQLNLWNADYGIGIQPGTLAFRSGDNFVWYRRGVYSATQNDAGQGGSLQMILNDAGNLGLGGLTAPANRLDLALGSRTGTHATGRALYATGDFGEASGGVEFRHSNGTQGVGIGFNSLYASGSNANQYLNLMPKGTGGVGIGTLTPTEKLDVAGNVKISGTGNGLIFPDGSKQTTATTGGDNLGNHTATQNLNLADKLLVGNGGAAGLSITNAGNVGIGGAAAASAALDVNSTSKGLLPPRLSEAQRDAIPTPAPGLLVYNTSTGALNQWDGTRWISYLSVSNANTIPSTTFNFTGGPQTYRVPLGVTKLAVDLAGGAGSTNIVGGTFQEGGRGGRVQATLTVTPGQELTIYVGGNGNYGGNNNNNGGGGGGTDISIGGTRVLVAGGGGAAGQPGRYGPGWGTGSPGGPGGGTVGGAGAGAAGGQGGTGTGPGAGGANAGLYYTPGNSGAGAIGGSPVSLYDAVSGGGGGGYYGGGSGGAGYYGAASGGGGGSSYAAPGQTSNVVHTQGYQTLHGYVTITPAPGVPAPVLNGANFQNVPGDNLGNHQATQALQFPATTSSKVNLFNGDYTIGVQGGTQYFRTGDAFAWFKGGGHNDGQFNSGGGAVQMVLTGGGSLGLGTSSPVAKFDIPTGSVRLPGAGGSDTWFNYPGDNKNYLRGSTIIADGGGYVGIGTSSPAYPLDVNGSVTPGNFTYGYLNTGGAGGNATSTGPISIRASHRILATEFNANSDRRLKTIIGLSDKAADLALLRQLRITDYQMRDRVQYGQRRFKKVIAQEVEQVFPQAVNQQVGFLPDVYALATQAELQADSLLVLTLPATPATAPKAGQRVKLIGKTGEVIGTVKAASGQQLVLRGARQLAGQSVFVFGLEHPDVRSVDYEALAMLNVSATQELARQVQELQQQNARLQQQNQAQSGRLDQQQATLQTQAAQTAELAQRLKALEALLGARADGR